MIAEVKLFCGRYHLSIAGITLAMEGDVCRAILPEDYSISGEELVHAHIGSVPVSELPTDVARFFHGCNWTKKMLIYVADKINEEKK